MCTTISSFASNKRHLLVNFQCIYNNATFLLANVIALQKTEKKPKKRRGPKNLDITSKTRRRYFYERCYASLRTLRHHFRQTDEV